MYYGKLGCTIALAGLAYFITFLILGMVAQVILPFDWGSIGGMRSPGD